MTRGRTVASTVPSSIDGPRSRRQVILDAAVQTFGENGYEATKWSDVADLVGIGQTALYHYFVSKAHCLLTIMQLQLEQDLHRMREIIRDEPDVGTAVRTVLLAVMVVDDQNVMRRRVLVSNIGLLAVPRSVPAEEAERRAARRLVQAVEEAWTEVLARGMDEGRFPRRNPRHLAGAVLGLVTSVWRWYRPGGGVSTQEVGTFYADCAMRMIEH